MSIMYNSIKRYYDMGKYSLEQMYVFVRAIWITPNEYYTITKDKVFLQILVEEETLTPQDYLSITGEEYQKEISD